MLKRIPVNATLIAAVASAPVCAQTSPDNTQVNMLGTITVESSADASAKGLMPVYAGGQVSRGSRIGLLGSLDTMDTPFNAMEYTNTLIEDQQAASVADILQSDPGVRVARGFGNYQQLYIDRKSVLKGKSVSVRLDNGGR